MAEQHGVVFQVCDRDTLREIRPTQLFVSVVRGFSFLPALERVQARLARSSTSSNQGFVDLGEMMLDRILCTGYAQKVSLTAQITASRSTSFTAASYRSAARDYRSICERRRWRVEAAKTCASTANRVLPACRSHAA